MVNLPVFAVGRIVDPSHAEDVLARGQADMVGMTREFNPRFLRRYLNLYDDMTNAFKQYSDDVKSQDFPNMSEQY